MSTERTPGTIITDKFANHEVLPITRSNGGKATFWGAYITGENVFDERTQTMQKRPKNHGEVLAHEIVGPPGQKWTTEQLWNAAEKSEDKSTRRNEACVGRHTILALPYDDIYSVDLEAYKRLARGYCLFLRDRYGITAQWAIHGPDPAAKTDEEKKNYHLHIVESSRKVSLGSNGEPVFDTSKDGKNRLMNRPTGPAEIEARRAEWEKRVNSELAKAGSVYRMDHRSHARRTAESDAPLRQPGVREGVVGRKMRREHEAKVKEAFQTGKPKPKAPPRVAAYYDARAKQAEMNRDFAALEEAKKMGSVAAASALMRLAMDEISKGKKPEAQPVKKAPQAKGGVVKTIFDSLPTGQDLEAQARAEAKDEKALREQLKKDEKARKAAEEKAEEQKKEIEEEVEFWDDLRAKNEADAEAWRARERAKDEAWKRKQKRDNPRG